MRTLLLTASLLLVAPGAAAAATPGDYGGGGFAAKTGKVTWMWARVAPDGTARVGGNVALGCALARFDAEVTVAADGTFQLDRSRVTRERGHVIRARVVITGKFEGAAATGLVGAIARDRTPRGRVQRCRTRRAQPWKLHLRHAAGAPGAAQPRGEYLGLTSQIEGVPKPFVLRVNRKATRIPVAIFDYARLCRRAGPIPLNNFTPGGRIRADGTFTLHDRFTLPFRGGIRERFRIRLDGQFTAGGVTGSLRARSVARRNGRAFDRCDTGALTFTALL